jgi:hypothetical protein
MLKPRHRTRSTQRGYSCGRVSHRPLPRLSLLHPILYPFATWQSILEKTCWFASLVLQTLEKTCWLLHLLVLQTREKTCWACYTCWSYKLLKTLAGVILAQLEVSRRQRVFSSLSFAGADPRCRNCATSRPAPREAGTRGAPGHGQGTWPSAPVVAHAPQRGPTHVSQNRCCTDVSFCVPVALCSYTSTWNLHPNQYVSS